MTLKIRGPGRSARLLVVVGAALWCSVGGAETVDYKYDELGRLRQVIQDDAKVTTYDLDPAGNRTNVTTAQGNFGTIQFSAGTFAVSENGGSVAITVTRAGGSTGTVGVTLASSNGSASAGSDYTAINTTLVWTDGETGSKSANLVILDDSAFEGAETVALALSSATGGATLGSPGSATLTINDNEVAPAGTLQFTSSTFAAGESAGSVVLTVSRVGGSNGAVNVSYATSNLTATAGSDYTATSGLLSWANGDTATKQITVPILEDTAVEGNETVRLTLSSPTGGATLGSPSTATLTINDNDHPPSGAIQLSFATTTVSEAATTVGLSASRTGGSWGAVSVTYTTANGTATAGSDYTAKTGTLSWADGDTANKSGTVTILNDSAFEGSETFTITLSAPTNDATLGSPSVLTVTIADDEAAPTFSISGATVNESAGSVTLTVSKSGSSSMSHSVNYATANGSATSGADYTSTSGVLTFTSAETSKTFTVPLLDDTVYEGGEAFSVSLSNATGGAVIGTGSASVNLTDNETAPAFSASNFSVNENAGVATVTVTKTGATALVHSVNFATSQGGATAGSDFTTTSGTLTFQPAETSKTFNVTIVNDAIFEDPESFFVSYTSPTNNATVATPTQTITITNTSAAPAFSISNASLAENGGAMSFTITKSGSTTLLHSVQYATASGTATAGADFTTVSGTANFAPSDTAVTFTVPITNDSVYEGTESFAVNLSAPTAGATLGTASGTGSITDTSNPPYFTIGDTTVNENAGTATLTVTKGGSTALTHNVSYANNGGSATAGADFSAFSGTLSFAPGETTKSITVSLLDDAAFEGNEYIYVPLSNPTNGSFLSLPNSGTVTIVDNDAANVIRIDDQSAVTWESFPPAYGGYSLTAAGDVLLNGSDVGDWLSPKSGMSNYQAMATQTGNSGPCSFGGTYGTWQDLGVGATWSAGIGSENTNAWCSINVQIRAKSNPSVVLDGANIDFNLNTGL